MRRALPRDREAVVSQGIGFALLGAAIGLAMALAAIWARRM